MLTVLHSFIQLKFLLIPCSWIMTRDPGTSRSKRVIFSSVLICPFGPGSSRNAGVSSFYAEHRVFWLSHPSARQQSPVPSPWRRRWPTTSTRTSSPSEILGRGWSRNARPAQMPSSRLLCSWLTSGWVPVPHDRPSLAHPSYSWASAKNVNVMAKWTKLIE